MSTLRRSGSDRVMGALWGALVAGVGALMIAVFSGRAVDMELAGIIALAAVGAWLVISAVLTGRERRSNKPVGYYESPAEDTAKPAPKTKEMKTAQAETTQKKKTS